ncbi:envelope stress response membrane protein PspC [Vibrio sp. JC009]|uniref:envelope stress response membrane protein PspC n=1 Tax=Vibrio sp. JC009 TaxID=2912314 RepID=UPI0023B0E383|nr:envelope stress response membrane protein PspC [Vibrio sp. JC009]WED20720.1 envelope stress response membrane protein PspC [Vibrio sp. JC009]
MSDRQLFRDTVNGKLTGVCAGIAGFFGLEIWLVRILVVSAALLGGSFLVILAYVALTLMLEKQPYDQRDFQSPRDYKLKSKAWQAGQSPSGLLDKLDFELGDVESRVKDMEAYVTSEAFKVNREFKNL